MYRFSQLCLEELLEIDNADEKSISIQSSSTGPGGLDMHALLAGEKNCFLLPKIVSVSPKPSIIVCDPFLAHRAPDDYSMSLIHALFDQVWDIYLWPSSETLVNIAPINTAHDFWQQRSSLHASTAEQVRSALANQGHDLKKYIVLDQARLHSILLQLKETLNVLSKDFCGWEATPVTQLDLSYFLLNEEDQQSEFLQKFLPGLTVEKITVITIDIAANKNTLIFLNKYFPNLNRLIIEEEYQNNSRNLKVAWLVQHASYLKTSKIQSLIIKIDSIWRHIFSSDKEIYPFLNIVEYGSEDWHKMLRDPLFCQRMECLQLYVMKEVSGGSCILDLNHLKFPALKNLKITIDSAVVLDLDLDKHPQLHTLSLRGGKYQITGSSQTIENLSIKICYINNIDIKQCFPAIKKLYIKQVAYVFFEKAQIWNLKIISQKPITRDHPQLKYLLSIKYQQLGKDALSGMPVQSMDVYSDEFTISDKTECLESASVLYYANDIYQTRAINISQCSQLKYLKIKSMQTLVMLGLKQCVNLQILILDIPNAEQYVKDAPKNCWVSHPNKNKEIENKLKNSENNNQNISEQSSRSALTTSPTQPRPNESLDQHNKENNVSRVTLNNSFHLKIDSETGVSKENYEAHGDFTVNLLCSSAPSLVDKNFYRLFFLDEMMLNKSDDIKFSEVDKQFKAITDVSIELVGNNTLIEEIRRKLSKLSNNIISILQQIFFSKSLIIKPKCIRPKFEC